MTTRKYILVHYDLEKKNLVIHRMLSDSILSNDKVLHTSYSENELKSLGLDEASKVVGEDILICLKDTSELFSNIK